ncbi:MAG: mannose-6-phosphate isomerase, class I [Chitinophagaceae bacterium]|nr:mannose-6-phosphate isomerase, class I [Chitinophagaceae bacterium]
MAGIARLSGTVKHYDWGGFEFIPSLLNVKNTDGKPFAEYWLGAHPLADCVIAFPDGRIRNLRDVFSESPADTLGAEVSSKYGGLPYLLKVLDVKDMLSIQVHPSKQAAKRDFDEENLMGVPLTSPERNYKDENHKPELLVAIGEFWLLHGFKQLIALRQTLTNTRELQFLLPILDLGYVEMYRKVMEMPQEEVNTILQPLLDRIIPLYKNDKLNKSKEDFWAARAALSFFQPGKIDRGIFSIYLFNLIKLKKGQAVFQDAGVPHAYLEGQNVEIMANSDNVLRGGLTTKHVDVHQLIKHVKCEPTDVEILNGAKHGDTLVYKTVAPDFELAAFQLNEANTTTIKGDTAEILLLIEGKVELSYEGNMIVLEKGNPSAILFPGTAATVLAIEPSLVYKATVANRQ